MRRTIAALAIALLLAAGPGTHMAGPAAVLRAQPAVAVPTFEVDPAWPKLPSSLMFGEVSSVTVDRRDHIWVIQRPRTVPADQRDKAAPPVLEFDASGKYIKGFGGPSDAYEWPDNEHAIFVDGKDRVWIGGNAPQGTNPPRSDDMLLTFTNGGKFLRQIGRREKSTGNKDTENLKRPADLFVNMKTNEAFVADGYGNRRVIVLDADTGRFKRMWGAFSNEPLDPPARGTPPGPAARGAAPASAPAPQPDREGAGPQQFGTVHAVEVSKDGLVYVGDRDNSRVQVFTLDGKYVSQAFINRTRGGTTAAGLAFSSDGDQRFLYVADQANSLIHIVLRKTMEVVGSFGQRGLKPGEFQGLHHIASDSKGNIYTAEAQGGRRVQKLVFKGTANR
jgi:DNA-binding beta-propeller fold protein YncE